jgi:hypothetical protein
MLVAPLQTLSFVVRDADDFAVELRVRASDGRTRTIRWDTRLAGVRVGGRRAALPLETTPVPGSTFRLATLDVADAVSRMGADLKLAGILNVRLRGTFEIGDLLFEDALP